MSKLTPIHYKKFDKFLKYVGCTFDRQKGSHRIYKRPDLKRPIIIPADTNLPVFVILNNLRILKISRKEYLDILNKI